MEKIKADIVVIGSGPAGQKAAIQAAKYGKKVIMVEKDPDPGGTCLYSGTIPSKTFREAIIDLTRFYKRKFVKEQKGYAKVAFEDLRKRLSDVTEEQKAILYRQLRKNKIKLIAGVAGFINPYEVTVKDSSGKEVFRLIADYYIIATGSKPRKPKEVPFDDEVILDSTSLLRINRIPKSMIVLGGGVIGSEYSSFFSALGTEVTIIDKKDHILPFLDSEIGIHLQTALTDTGVRFMGNKMPDRILREGDRGRVEFADGTGLVAETVLFTLGRSGNVEGLDIQNAGLTTNDKGYIYVNPLFQTERNHIYAAGDVIGGPCLASTSMEQGRIAARHACGAETTYFPTHYPIGIYSIPEISSFGYTEDRLRYLGYNYEVGRAYYYEIARSHIAGGATGMIKIVFHKETLEILGVHAIGKGATEFIHIGQVAIGFNAKLDYFISHIFNYPTYAEGYRIAALNGLNKIKRGSDEWS